MSLERYIELFSDLKPNRSGGRASPHKACLLLAVIDLIDEGVLTDNRIPFDTSLKDAFSRRFATFSQVGDKDNPALPYFHLTSQGFWRLHAVAGQEAELNSRLTSRDAPSATATTKLIEYAMLDDDLYGLLQVDFNRSVLVGVLKNSLLSGEAAFSAWCREMGKSEATIKKYSGALTGSLSDWLSDHRGEKLSLLDIRDSQQLLAVKADLLKYELFVERDQVGNRMYSAALNLYEKYLQDSHRENSLENDLRELDNRQLDSTVRATLVSARRGQGIFRERVLKYWQNRCAVTGYGHKKFLLASHIKPWRDSGDEERLDRFNGLALTPSLDRAFDLGYVSFDTSGDILISSELEEPKTLGISADQSIKLRAEHQAYLEFHRSEIFMK